MATKTRAEDKHVKLYLAQHGEALPEDVDPERPLSETGRRDVQALARFLAARGLRVEQIQHSGKTRARQTAEILARAVAAGTTPEQVEGIAPRDPPEDLARLVASADADLMVVGHLPYVARLVSLLVAGEFTVAGDGAVGEGVAAESSLGAAPEGGSTGGENAGGADDSGSSSCAASSGC